MPLTPPDAGAILALDLGASTSGTGYALAHRVGAAWRVTRLGVWDDLGVRDGPRGGRAVVKGLRTRDLRERLYAACRTAVPAVAVLVHERAPFARYAYAAQVHGALVSAVEEAGAVEVLPVAAVGVSTVKKALSGSGRADRAAMAAAALERWGVAPPEDAVDALGVLAAVVGVELVELAPEVIDRWRPRAARRKA